MNTKLLVLMLATTTIITLSLPSLAEKVISTVLADSFVEEQSVRNVPSLTEEAPCLVEISRLVGRSYHIGTQTCELTSSGLVSGGFFQNRCRWHARVYLQ